MTKASQPKKAPKSPEMEAAEKALNVQNLGDVTERNDTPAPAPVLVELQPLDALPKEYASLAETYRGAKGFTVEGVGIALHF